MYAGVFGRVGEGGVAAAAAEVLYKRLIFIPLFVRDTL